jgi:hypothetical protein
MNGRALVQASMTLGRDFADDSFSDSASTSTKNRYATARRLAALERGMSDRDRAVISTLARVRVATARQLYRLHFQDVTRRRARAGLASLAGRRLIARLPRVVGGVRAGSTGYVYALDVAGQRLIRTGTRAQRPWSVGRTFLDHSLTVTELYVQLAEADRAGRLHLAEFATEPACWRHFHGPGGARLVLKPDAVLRLRLGRYEDRWWLEADCGTESRTTLARRCEQYRLYWQAGVEQARTGVFPRMLWVVPDEQREAVLVDVITRQPADARPLFAVARFAEAVERLVQGAGI